MKQNTTRELFTYWNEIRRERAAPERADIDPAAIRSILGETFMIETDEAKSYPIRLSGSRLNALLLKELKGHSFLDLWEDRGNMAAILATVMDGVAPVLAGVSASPIGRKSIDLELLLLPLRHRGKTHARILGSLAYASEHPWLGLIPIERLSLQSLRIMTETNALVRLPMRRASSIQPLQPAIRTRDHLRVYPGGLR